MEATIKHLRNLRTVFGSRTVLMRAGNPTILTGRWIDGDEGLLYSINSYLWYLDYAE